MCYDGCGAETLQASSCGGNENLSLHRDEWFFFCGKHARRNDLQCNGSVASISTGCDFFVQEPPSVAIRSFYADIFEIRELQLKAKNERILELRHAQESGVWEIAISSSDVWKCLCRLKKGKSSPDGVTAEMLLALPVEQILCLARNMQAMLSSLNFQGDLVSGRGVSHSQKKRIREVSMGFVPSVA